MTGHVKYRSIVRDIALDNFGYVTTAAAKAAGVPAVELPKLAARGGLANVAYGLYRVEDVPVTKFDQYAEALLRVGADAYLFGVTVLALLGLAEVNPRTITIAVHRRTRPQLPTYIELVHVGGEKQATLYEGLLSQPVADAILECRGSIESIRLKQAAEQARAEGLLTTTEYLRVKKAIRQ